MPPLQDAVLEPFYDAFISYGRADSKAFAAELHRRLTDLGYRIWFDQNDIPLGVDYQKQIDEGIQRSHNFLFVIAPHSTNSPYCGLEIDQALTFKKRIVPLLHVEAISREIWQQRHPEGADEAWQAYQDKGLHSGLINLRPAISKINWIFSREGIDDLDASFRGLVELIERDREYVHQHTQLLTQAIAWDRSQRPVSKLLVGQARTEAQAWLLRRFPDRQPPCLPTWLQAEYICESQKYADQWMSRVFLAFADADRHHQEHIWQALLLEGITVWSSRTDIQSGKDFQAEIQRGIENTDNLVVLLSSQALRSAYCLREIQGAFDLNKRVIPLLIEPMDLAAAVEAAEAVQAAFQPTLKRLQQIQFLDFTAAWDSEAYRQSLDKLLKRLRDEADYFREHKELLVQALKWERQQHNPCILLRGAALRYYESWGRVAAQRSEQPPTALQQQFLAESLKQPTDSTLDVYLNCTSEDLEFARKLNDILQVQGKTTWFRVEAFKGDLNLLEEEQHGLECSLNALFIVSPSWLASPDSQTSLAHALSLNKRIIPVLYRPVDPAKLPSALASLPNVDFQRSGDFLTTFGELYRLLESEPEHVRGHTRLLLRARAWEDASRDDSYLLRGQELALARAWMHQAGEKIPRPTALQKDFVAASQALPQRRVRRRTVVWSAAVATTMVFAARLLGWLQPLELRAYDHLLRSRPSDPAQDERLLLVTVDEGSGEWLREQMKAGRYEPGIGTIPDQALNEALATLSAAQPAVIGLDFYRDFAAAPDLAQRLGQTRNLIGICKAEYQGKGVVKAPEMDIRQVGFNDFVRDRAQYMRRHHLMQPADATYCPTEKAFSLLLARQYLAQKGMAYTDPWEGETPQNMRFGQTIVPELWADGILTSHSAGYAPLSPALNFTGYQSMLNFRAYQGRADQFAPSVSLQALLTGQVRPEQIAGRIVLIGYSDRTDRNADYYNTPYGELPGLIVQGQMTSQLVSAALDQRPLIWWWPVGGETLWILGWALVGGGLVRAVVHPIRLVMVTAGGLILLYGVCYGILALGAGWVPLVPSAIASIGAGSIVAYLTYRVRHP